MSESDEDVKLHDPEEWTWAPEEAIDLEAVTRGACEHGATVMLNEIRNSIEVNIDASGVSPVLIVSSDVEYTADDGLGDYKLEVFALDEFLRSQITSDQDLSILTDLYLQMAAECLFWRTNMHLLGHLPIGTRQIGERISFMPEDAGYALWRTLAVDGRMKFVVYLGDDYSTNVAGRCLVADPSKDYAELLEVDENGAPVLNLRAGKHEWDKASEYHGEVHVFIHPIGARDPINPSARRAVKGENVFELKRTWADDGR